MSARHSGMSLSQIAEKLGLTKQAVYQIEQQAIAKLRHAVGSDYSGPIGAFLLDSCGSGDDTGMLYEEALYESTVASRRGRL